MKIIRQKIPEVTYYDYMGNMICIPNFDEIHRKWRICFSYILKNMGVGYTDKIITHLFYEFDMENWSAMHQENSEFKDKTNEELIELFGGECSYISDRTSYDRLFRAQWLFRRAYEKEINKIKYPSLYED